MDRLGEWRPIPAAAKDDADEQPSAKVPASAGDTGDGPEANALSVRLLGLLGAGVLAIVGAAIWLTNPGLDGETRLDVAGAAGYFSPPTDGFAGAGAARFTATPTELVIDVQGAVAQPGVHRIPVGSRVGDAIDAAGGYSAQVDLAAASASLNLAAILVDGSKIHVPARGETVLPSAATGGTAGGAGGLVNLNAASADELDTLPGIGPVTAAKIIAAREQAPFATLDELVTRDVLGTATLEKIRALATVAP